MTTPDFIVIAAFTILIVFIGMSFSGTSGKNMKSFFAAGGAMPWWISSLSLFMGFVSAGTFVVWGSIAYSSGWVSVSIQWTMSLAGFLVGFLIAPKWHKTKALTAAEYITGRLGINVQKTYTYLYLSIMVFMTGVYLYSVSRLLEVSTGLPLNYAIVLLGILVILYTSVGGLWAVVVTDTLQFIILTAAAIIVVPLSLEKVGGIHQFITSLPTQGFLDLTNHEYTWSFLLGFGLYNFFYLSGQWGFVQRYTSVKSPSDARKVGWLFGALYIISPVIWMLPPMIYRVINNDLSGLQDEGAYLMMSKEVLPAGMLGLMMISLVFATTSSVQGVLNISAGVITNDLYRNKFPDSTEKRLMGVAKISTISFGIITMAIALMVPFMGGAKEVVLSVAALTGCPLYLPLIWSLFSKKQTGKTILASTIISLIITLSFKFFVPHFFDFNLSRAGEMILGVLVPALLIVIFEVIIRLRNIPDSVYYQTSADLSSNETAVDNSQPSDNKQGLRMIAVGIIATGIIMGIIGLTASSGKLYVLGMAFILLLIGIRIITTSLNKK